MKTIRILHRYVGFFLVGIMAMYAFTGIILTYRNTNFLKSEKIIENQLRPGLSGQQVGEELHMRRFKITNENDSIIIFNENGSYDKATGNTKYTTNSYPAFIQKLVSIHLTASGSFMSVLTTVFGVGLLFLAISSFWMFKPQTKMFKKGIIVILGGIIFTIVLVMLS